MSTKAQKPSPRRRWQVRGPAPDRCKSAAAARRLSQVRHLPRSASGTWPLPGLIPGVEGQLVPQVRRLPHLLPQHWPSDGLIPGVRKASWYPRTVRTIRHDDRPDRRHAHPDPQRRPDRAAARRHARLQAQGRASPRCCKDEGYISATAPASTSRTRRRRRVPGGRRSASRTRAAGYLKYGPNGERLITQIDRSASPAAGSTRATRNSSRSSTAWASRSSAPRKGVISDRQARSEKVGGEVLCTVW